MAEMTCAEFQSMSAELALGVAEARERAQAIVHLEGCASCRRELSEFAEVADALGALTPALEPPAGFEERILARTAGSPPVESGLRQHWQRLVAAAAAAVLIAVGGWMLGHSGGAPAPRGVVTAQLLSSRGDIGEVVIGSGRQPWVSMAVHSSLGDSLISCELRTTSGRTIDIGSFWLSNGAGYWASALQSRSITITRAQLVDGSGKVVATATIPALAVG